MKSNVWLASDPRIRVSVREPAGPDVATAAEGTRRRKAAARGSPNRSISSWSMMVMLAAVEDCSSGVREAVMTIWSVLMGKAGMGILL